ncbi:MAG: hypothetical protein J6V37_03800 [Clostridia bacterium]|nr:hypothetical protein [Clostridia bacterium]
MKETIVTRISKLFSVKSLVTLILTAVFAYLAVNKAVIPDNFMTVYAVVISFYFGTQATKKEETHTTKEE